MPVTAGRPKDDRAFVWAFPIVSIAGIRVYVHVTFLVLLAWAGALGYLQNGRASAAAANIAFLMLLFTLVVLHEFGHAAAARGFGIKTRDITLLPIGGMARLERFPDRPWQELIVALAGPAVNFVLAFAAWAAAPEIGPLPTEHLAAERWSFWTELFWINFMLGGFNLLPAFPMDGGRVLRAVLAMGMSRVSATRWAALVGQGFALVLGLAGLMGGQVLLVLIAVFVWFAGGQEARAVEITSELSGATVGDVMVREFRTLGPRESVAAAAEHVLAGFQQDFPVVEDGRLVGFVTLRRLLPALSRLHEPARVGEVMNREVEPVSPSDDAFEVMTRLQASGEHAAPVVEGGRVTGLFTLQNVGEYLLIHKASART